MVVILTLTEGEGSSFREGNKCKPSDNLSRWLQLALFRYKNNSNVSVSQFNHNFLLLIKVSYITLPTSSSSATEFENGIPKVIHSVGLMTCSSG